jgi:hypothetical protein
MRTARVLAVLIVALLAVVGGADELTRAPMGARTPCGRYQLFQATYRSFGYVAGKFSSGEEIGLFKIDTDTGKTWIYVDGSNKDGEIIQKWVPVSN